jgi:protein-disulfide isomerase
MLALFLASTALGAAGPLIEGNPSASVRVVIYEDLQCPDCAAFRKMLDEKLLPKYGANVAFEHRDFPLTKHAWARKAAIASRFFQQTSPELALAYRRHTLENLRAIRPDAFNQDLAGFASKHGIDGAQALDALDRADLAAAVEKDYQDGVARGVAKTPTALVNGVPFIETFTFEEISKAIDEALKR